MAWVLLEAGRNLLECLRLVAAFPRRSGARAARVSSCMRIVEQHISLPDNNRNQVEEGGLSTLVPAPAHILTGGRAVHRQRRTPKIVWWALFSSFSIFFGLPTRCFYPFSWLISASHLKFACRILVFCELTRVGHLFRAIKCKVSQKMNRVSLAFMPVSLQGRGTPIALQFSSVFFSFEFCTALSSNETGVPGSWICVAGRHEFRKI
jgi:hypothetical protein